MPTQTLEEIATKVLRICLADPPPPAVAGSVKLAGIFAQIHRILHSHGWQNFNMLVKSAIILIAYIDARAKIGVPVEIGPNHMEVPNNTPLLEALKIGPRNLYEVKKKRVHRAFNGPLK